MYKLFRPWLFRLKPEQAHGLTLQLVRLAGMLPPVAAGLRLVFQTPVRRRQVWGLDFTNPVGLAAGYDKDGLGWRGLACLGFGHIEIGTVTPLPQPGNPRPRVFRLVDDRAVINRMGFPGLGAEVVQRQLLGRRPAGLILGVNLGKNKATPLERAAEDYLSLFQTFAPLADYLAVNVSSPNTVGLRRLQARETLEALLQELAAARKALDPARLRRSHLPVLVKLAPDLTSDELDDALAAIGAAGMDGVIATNTTLRREGLTSALAGETGGLSGEPLFAHSLAFVHSVVERTKDQLPVIGVGGIMNPEQAMQMFDAGASLVQVYTGLIYAGPGLVQQIVKAVK